MLPKNLASKVKPEVGGSASYSSLLTVADVSTHGIVDDNNDSIVASSHLDGFTFSRPGFSDAPGNKQSENSGLNSGGGSKNSDLIDFRDRGSKCNNNLDTMHNDPNSVNILLDETSEDKRYADAVTWFTLVLNCLILGPLNFLLYKVLYTAYMEPRAFFVSQGVNVIYVVVGGLFLAFADWKGEITDDMRQISHWKFVVMGGLDCLAGFMSAMGASSTNGAVLQILNQALIPCTMIASWFMLGNRSSPLQVIGSLIILCGAVVVMYPSLTRAGQGSSLSAIIYFCSNIPFACSYCYKEYGFKNLSIHVLYLTQWVSVYQLLIGFCLAPLQMIPGMGSKDGMTFQEILLSFKSGISCFFEANEDCQHKHAFWLLIGYCLTNFVFNTLGLYLVKKGSATLVSISYSIILPVTTLAFTLPFLGSYQEPFQKTTFFGLVITLLGFFLWKSESLACFDKFTELVYTKLYDLFGYNEINQLGDIDDVNVEMSPISNPMSPQIGGLNAGDLAGVNRGNQVNQRVGTKTSVKQRLTSLGSSSVLSPSSSVDKRMALKADENSTLEANAIDYSNNNSVDIELNQHLPSSSVYHPSSFQHGDLTYISSSRKSNSVEDMGSAHRDTRRGAVTGMKARVKSWTSAYLRRSLPIETQTNHSNAPDSFSERTLVVGPLI